MTLTQITTGGVDENINIDSNTLKVDGTNNRVGINTATPSAPLDVVGNDGIAIQSSAQTNEFLIRPSSSSADGIRFTQAGGGGDRMVIDSSGRVGINTTSPSSFFAGADQLVVSGGSGDGGITIDSGTSSIGRFLFADGTTGADQYRGYLAYNHSDNFLTLGTNGSERLRIDSSGRVHVASTGNSGANLFVAGGSGQSAGTEVDIARFFASTASSTNSGGLTIGGVWHNTDVNQRVAYLQSEQGNNPGSTARHLALNPGGGNVGVGTKAPSFNVDVVSTSFGLRVTNSSESKQIKVGCADPEVIAVGAPLYLTAPSSQPLILRANGDEKARVDSSGRMLIGTSTASSAGQAQYAYLEVSGSTAGATGSSHINIKRGEAASAMSNGDTLGRLIFTGLTGGDFAYIQASVDGSPSGSDYPGRLMFNTCADGSSSATERLRITATGQLQSHSEGSTTLKPMQGCRAYCCFKGTGTVSIHSSFNVSSITDLAVGHYEINFSTAMIDANYGITSGFQRNAANDEFVNVGYDNTTARLRAEFFDSGTRTDCQRMTVSVFR